MVFAHLSDIHLAGYDAGAMFDEDADLRRELEYDLERVTLESGQLDALMLGGDIVGRGDEREYEAAARWVETLCANHSVPLDRVYCVPGNHDVVRAAVSEDPVLGLTRDHLLSCDPMSIGAEFRRFYSSGPHRHILMGALENYNQFAAKYGCAIEPDRHLWNQVIQMGGLPIRIMGLSSALLCGPGDSQVAASSRLSIGPQIQQISRLRDTFTIVMCHHPLQWMRDGPQYEYMAKRAQLQLFGHEHAFAVDRSGAGIRVAAGAVHPARGGKEDAVPSYNVIALEAPERQPSAVTVRVWARAFKEHGAFGPVELGRPIDTFEVPLVTAATEGAESPVHVPVAGPPPPMTPAAMRRAARSFALLSTERQLKIGGYLGLLAGDDRYVGEPSRGRVVFRRAVERGMLKELEELMSDDQ